MQQQELIRIVEDGREPTISFRAEHINRIDTARRISQELSELLGEIKPGEIEPYDYRPPQLNLDCSDIRWIGSAALNELIGINSQARNHGVQLVLLDVPQSVRDVFALTRLERMFEFSSSSVNA